MFSRTRWCKQPFQQPDILNIDQTSFNFYGLKIVQVSNLTFYLVFDPAQNCDLLYVRFLSVGCV